MKTRGYLISATYKVALLSFKGASSYQLPFGTSPLNLYIIIHRNKNKGGLLT